MVVYQIIFLQKYDSKLADENFSKHKSDKNIFFLKSISSTYGFILNSGQYQDYSGLRNKNQNNKICKFVAITASYLGQGSDFHHFQKMPITRKL